MPQVSLHNLSKTFLGPDGTELRALRSVSLEVNPHELLVIAGPSGSGKTTLLRLVAGLDQPRAGTIHIDGQLMNDLPPARRKLSMVFQQNGLYPHLTASENLALALHGARLSRHEVQKRVEQVATQLGLNGLLTRRPAQLSGGEQQRIALGRAFIRQAPVLLLDEPFSSLDAPVRQQLRMELTRWQDQLGLTMIYVTHDQEEAMTLGRRIALLRQGSLEQVGTPAELYRHPRNIFTASFLGQPPMNLFRGSIFTDPHGLFFREEDNLTAKALGELTLRLPEELRSRLEPHSGRKIHLGLRPEHLRCELPQEPSTGPSGWTSTLQRIQNTGPNCHLFCTTQTHPFMVRTDHEPAFTPPQLLSIVPDLNQARFFDGTTGLLIA